MAEAAGGEADRQPELRGGALDISSPRFDPYLALYSPQPPPLPFPGVRTFNNVAEYESFLTRRPGSGSRPRGQGRASAKARSRRGAAAAPDPERIERLKKLMVAEASDEEKPRPRRRDRAPKNVMTRMARAARLLQPGARYGVGHGHLHDRLQGCFDIGLQKFMRAVLWANSIGVCRTE